MRLVGALWVLLAGCTFHPGNSPIVTGDGHQDDAALPIDGRMIDAPGGTTDGSIAPDAPPPPIDGAPNLCFGGGNAYKVCLAALPGGPATISSGTINTSPASCTGTNPYRQVVTVTNGPQLCVVAGTVVAISGTVRAEGSLPLAILATSGDLNVNMSSVIDVSSARGGTPGAGANYQSCTSPGGANTGDGGAGGSFGGKGGNGGGGAAASNAVTPTFVRGGCRGGNGGNGATGGNGGGAVYLLAQGNLNIGAGSQVDASGAGGSPGGDNTRDGGGGGGAGGMIALWAGGNMQLSGDIFANGGGGGTGCNGAGCQPGAESSAPTSPGAGGGNGGMMTTAGGTGAYGANAAGSPTAGGKGSGGGGGGVGVIKNVSGQPLVTGNNISPPLS